jgi:hypothetical protein
MEGGYKLSTWDNFILESLKDAGNVLINSDLQDRIGDWMKKEGIKADENTAKAKISRSIHKLANKKGDIVKTKYEGRGFAYGLKDWFNPNGSLKRKYQRKAD